MNKFGSIILLVIIYNITNITMTQASEDTRSLSAEVLWELKRVGSPVISPDGQRFCSPFNPIRQLLGRSVDLQGTVSALLAENFNTPALIIHGQLDYRVPVGQAFELFRTLQSRGINSKLIYYPDENHWILKPNNSIYWYSQVRQWIGKYAAPGGN